MIRSVALITICALGAFSQESVPAAHWHHAHINAAKPKFSVEFYTSTFDCEKVRYRDRADAVWAQKSWILFAAVQSPPPSDIVSAIWHIGWGAEDMKAAYAKQIAVGTRFQTPLTDISALAGRPPGNFFYAYVDGPSHELIELNTANHHRFGHLHLLSGDPVAAGEWYSRHLGIALRAKQADKRMYKGFPVGPSAALQADNVSILIYPVEYARVSWPQLWGGRKDFDSTRGRAIDHIAFSVSDLNATLVRLRSENVKVLEMPREEMGVQSAMIEGPDHIAIELVEDSPVKP